MTYVKNNWVDREGITRYFETIDEDGALIFTPDFTQITEMGTPVNADNMNHIEEGIDDHETRITKLEKGGAGMPIGSIFQAIRTDVPVNSLRADGTEYSSGFGNFLSNFLATGKILCKSFDEWQTEYTMTGGNVGFFAYNAETGTFKVPCVQAGTFLAQAVASGEFGSFLNSEIKSHAHIQTEHNHDRGTMNITGSTYGARGEFGASGCFQTTSTTSAGISIPGQSTQNGLAFNAANSWTGVTSTAQPTILPTGGDDTYPKHIRYPFFVVVSNVEAESPSQVVWDNFIENLADKVNTDLSNISASGKSLVSKFGAPSSRFIDLQLGASGTIYTAPANGWVCIRTITPDDYGFVSLALAEPYSMENLGRGKANECAATTLKVSAGAKFIVHYTFGELTYFRFHYAEGEVA